MNTASTKSNPPFLQLHQLLAMNEREVVIGEAINHITVENPAAYYRKGGLKN